MRIILIIFLVVLFSDCKNVVEDKIINEIQVDSLLTNKEKESPSIKFDNLISNLGIYSEKLLKSKFAFESTIDASFFYNNTKNGLIYNRLKETRLMDSIKYQLNSIEKHIINQNSVFLNSNLKTPTYTRYRGRIHEYIFLNDSIAALQYNKLMDIKNNYPTPWKLDIEWKSPAIMVVENNKIYHIITGGNNMKGIEKEIAATLFN